MMLGYIDIGRTLARVLVPIYNDDELIETVALNRAIPGRGKDGFYNLSALKTEFKLLAEELRSELGTPDLPYCSVAVKDSAALKEVRSISVQTNGKAIAESDILYLQKNINLEYNEGYVPLHRIPIGFRIDGGDLQQHPVGMKGDKLTFYAMIIAVRHSELKIYDSLLKEGGIGVRRYIYDGLAHGLAAIRETKEPNCTVFDLGANSTGVCVFENGHPVYLESSAVGMEILSRELKNQLRCSSETAESLKVTKGMGVRGNAIKYRLSNNKSQSSVDVPQFVNILRIQLNNVFQAARSVLEGNTWLESTPSFRHKIVLTGGGRSMSDMLPVAQQLLKVEVVVARGLQHTHGDNAFMACLGMWYYMLGDDLGEQQFIKVARIKKTSLDGFWQWLKGVFS
ncbi:MAG: hypothetical protein HRT36_01335 [Alphaproteobacteria bacterium]|nr:hypothetical protein [Alphaproteobacteria bacterium]